MESLSKNFLCYTYHMTLSKKIAVVLVVALVVVGVLYVAGRAKKVTAPETTVTSTAQAGGVSIAPMVTESHTQTDAHKLYTLQMTYPQSSTTVLPDVYNFVQSTKQQFLDDYNSVTDAEARDFPAEALAYNLTVTTRVATSTNTVTYIIEAYQFEGGAHGATTETTFTYDKTGKLITLDDVFIKPYLPTVALLARQYFTTILGDNSQADMIDSGTEATTTNFSLWYLTPSTITFIFGEYQVAPYSSGILEFPLQK